MSMFKMLVLSSVLAVSACKKKEEPKATPPIAEGSGSAQMGSSAEPTPSGSGSAVVAAGSGSAAPVAVDPAADYIVVEGTHVEKKATDPVEVKFSKFKVTKADFDPKKVEGGKASFEIDLASLSTGSTQRDGHLTSESYLDVGKFATATVDIDNVRKSDKGFAADATIKLHGVEKKYPVAFEVVETKDDSIRIKGEHSFNRLDFKVGTDDADPKKETVDRPLKVKLQLTLKKT